MFATLKEQPGDKILELSTAFRADPRPGKIDLGVGVYKDADGVTPVMGAIREAERRIWEAETTKTYTSLTGEPAFLAAMARLVLADTVASARIASIATPGGTGAVRIALDLAHRASPEATVWVSDPTWPNHHAIITAVGLKGRSYRYFDSTTGGLDSEGMFEDLGRVAEGDVVLLHGCCHNPTGANPSTEEWKRIVAILKERGALPLVDLAYQGFGDGLDEDAFATRLIAREIPQALVAASCSKNFGIYRERTGVVLAVAPDAAQARLVQQNLDSLNRVTYSFPPDHGARLVQTVLDDAELAQSWREELERVRTGMLELRTLLAEELRRRTNSDRFDFIARHRGMFSRIGASPEQVARLREEYGIYMVGDSRINIAGLNPEKVVKLAEAMLAVGV